jgi:non-ribosomal peptide synthetase component F/acyl carrier protein
MIYYNEKRYPDTAAYNLAHTVRYPGTLDNNLLEKAINTVLLKNEGLRLRIVEIPTETSIAPAQYISDYKEISIDYFDFTGKQGRENAEKWVEHRTKAAFNLLTSPLFYFACLKFNEKESGYYMNFHHIIVDQWACFLVFKEINKIYRALEKGESIDDTPNLSYTQFIWDEREYLESPRANIDREFWYGNLIPLPQEVDLSPAKVEPTSVKCNVCYMQLPGELRTRVHEYAKSCKTSIYKLILAALSIYIHRVTGCDDFAIGAINHNRSTPDHKKMVGMFIRFIPIRIKIDEDKSFRDSVGELGDNINYMIKNHHKYPFDLLAIELQEKTGVESGYLYNINLIGHPDLHEEFVIRRPFQGYEITPLTIHINRFNKDIQGILELEWIYQEKMFSREDVQEFHQGLVNILSAGLCNPGEKLSRLELLAQPEREQILYKRPRNEARLPYPGRDILEKQFKNPYFYILDKNGRVQPAQLPGELCIGSDGTPSLPGIPGNTRGDIAPNPFIKGGMIYKSGELARWLPDGNIELLGKPGHQVKVNGVLVDRSKVENCLLMHGDIKEVSVVARRKNPVKQYLCAGVVSGKMLVESELKLFLSKHLPSYMVPAHIIQFEKLPLNSRGKIDRNLLTEMHIPLNTRTDNSELADETEKKVAEIWADILGIGKSVITRDSHFIALGGHSLKATVLAARIHKELNVKLPLAEIFRTPTLKQIAESVKKAKKDNFITIERVKNKEYYPLSSAQKRLYFLQQLDKKSTQYNMPMIKTLQAELPREKIEDTFRRLLRRHESLRTSIVEVDGEPLQKIMTAVDFSVEEYEMKAVDGKTDGTNEVQKIIDAFVRPFDLRKAPFIRVGLIRINNQKQVLIVDLHHIISDAVSHNILVNDFMRLYQGKALPPLKLQYKDYSEWQQRLFESREIKKQENYWLKQFERDVPTLRLPIDFERPAVMSFEGKIIDFSFSAKKTKLLNHLAGQEGSTLYMVLLSVFYVLLYRLSSQEDIVIGTPIAGRRHADLQYVIGIFANTLALRNYPLSDKTFREFLSEVKHNTLEAFENQDYPFEMLVEKLALKRDLSRNPLFDIMFAFQADDGKPGENIEEDNGDLAQEQFAYENKTSDLDMILNGQETGGKLHFRWRYCSKLFEQETARGFIDGFERIIDLVTLDKETKLEEIELVGEEEKNHILSLIEENSDDIEAEFDI